MATPGLVTLGLMGVASAVARIPGAAGIPVSMSVAVSVAVSSIASTAAVAVVSLTVMVEWLGRGFGLSLFDVYCVRERCDRSTGERGTSHGQS